MMKIEAADRIDLRANTRRTVLAGRRAGEADLRGFRRRLRKIPEGSVVILDLSGVEVLSSSYFLAALWPLWRSADSPPRELYPILANASEAITDEIAFVLEHCAGLAWHFDGPPPSPSPSLLGNPDQYDDDLLRLILKRGQLTARELLEHDPAIGITAWSTRLGQQHQSRLLRRHKDGKQMVYALPWSDIDG